MYFASVIPTNSHARAAIHWYSHGKSLSDPSGPCILGASEHPRPSSNILVVATHRNSLE
jgi:hypothetical protein